MLIIGFALALLVGLAMGLLGAGGSILGVPIFVYLLGFEAKQAIAMSLGVVGATSLIGAFRHGQLGNINLRVAVVFAPVAMVGTYLGAHLALFVSDAAQLALFGSVMLAAALFMVREAETPPAKRRHPAVNAALVVVEGLVVGVLTGVVGVGGGFLIVPVFILLMGLPVKEAVGTSLLVIALKSFAGFVGYLEHVDVAWGFMAGFTAIAIVGFWIGAHFVQRVPPLLIRRGFATLLLVMGVWMLYQNRSVVGL
jgi:uncharacterized membrane protein YfcA